MIKSQAHKNIPGSFVGILFMLLFILFSPAHVKPNGQAAHVRYMHRFDKDTFSYQKDQYSTERICNTCVQGSSLCHGGGQEISGFYHLFSP